MSAKTKRPPGGDRRSQNDCVSADAHSLKQNRQKSKKLAVILDRERIRDGMRKGQPTAAFVLILDDQVVWRGFDRGGAVEAAKQWIDQGARFVDMTEGAHHG